MADGSRYLKCDKDGCNTVFDKRPDGSSKDGGTYRWSGSWQDIVKDAAAAGWTWDGPPLDSKTKHFCPKHSDRDKTT